MLGLEPGGEVLGEHDQCVVHAAARRTPVPVDESGHPVEPVGEHLLAQVRPGGQCRERREAQVTGHGAGDVAERGQQRITQRNIGIGGRLHPPAACDGIQARPDAAAHIGREQPTAAAQHGQLAGNLDDEIVTDLGPGGRAHRTPLLPPLTGRFA